MAANDFEPCSTHCEGIDWLEGSTVEQVRQVVRSLHLLIVSGSRRLPNRSNGDNGTKKGNA